MLGSHPFFINKITHFFFIWDQKWDVSSFVTLFLIQLRRKKNAHKIYHLMFLLVFTYFVRNIPQQSFLWNPHLFCIKKKKIILQI